MLIDTHCHLADGAFAADLPEVLARGTAAGVGHVVAVGDNSARSDACRALAGRHDGVSATAGVHPHEASAWSPDVARWLRSALDDPVVVAVGETGLDYHYDNSPRDAQRRAFEAQLVLGAETDLPVVVHAREADEDIGAMLQDHPRTRVVLHSFSSGDRLLETALSLGHYVSWSGMVTFRRWAGEDQLRAVPDDRLLVETDAPYLAPVPHRGRRNEPAFVRAVAERVAAVRGCTVEDIADLTTANATRLFGDRLRPSVEVL